MTTTTATQTADISDSARGILMGLLAGVLFAAGLVISGMTDPAKVIGFLNVAALFTDAVPGEWDPSLAFVMGGAVIVTLIAYRHTQPDGNHKETLKSAKPWLTTAFSLPNRTDVDWPLISGGAMFGVGWALGGFCPGPALAAWTTNGDLVWFVPAMLISMWISSRIRG